MILDRVKISVSLVLIVIFALTSGCTATIEITQSVRNPIFKILSLDNFKISGINIINIKDKKSFPELTDIEQSKLSEAIAAKKLPSSFTLNILVQNPNDGSGGTRNMTALLKSFDWRLLIDGRETVSGNIKNEIEIKKDTVVTLNINIDLIKYFPELKSVNDLSDFAFSMGNNLSGYIVKVKPVVETELGPLVTSEISIVSKEFR